MFDNYLLDTVHNLDVLGHEIIRLQAIEMMKSYNELLQATQDHILLLAGYPGISKDVTRAIKSGIETHPEHDHAWIELERMVLSFQSDGMLVPKVKTYCDGMNLIEKVKYGMDLTEERRYYNFPFGLFRKSEKLSLGEAFIPMNYGQPWHMHTGTPEVITVLKGTIVYEYFKEGSMHSQELQSGMIVSVEKNVPHTIANMSREAAVITIVKEPSLLYDRVAFDDINTKPKEYSIQNPVKKPFEFYSISKWTFQKKYPRSIGTLNLEPGSEMTLKKVCVVRPVEGWCLSDKSLVSEGNWYGSSNDMHISNPGKDNVKLYFVEVL